MDILINDIENNIYQQLFILELIFKATCLKMSQNISGKSSL
jgi:hypothetical protein